MCMGNALNYLIILDKKGHHLSRDDSNNIPCNKIMQFQNAQNQKPYSFI